MSPFTTRVFGTFSVPADGLYQRAESVVGGRRLERSIFIARPFDDGLAARVTSLLDTVDDLDERARRGISEDTTATVGDFVAFHLEEVTELAGLTPEVFLKRLELVGLSVHPHDDDGFFIVLDYSPGRALSDQLLAVRFDASGELRSVSHES